MATFFIVDNLDRVFITTTVLTTFNIPRPYPLWNNGAIESYYHCSVTDGNLFHCGQPRVLSTTTVLTTLFPGLIHSLTTVIESYYRCSVTDGNLFPCGQPW